jgi:hypothetical protein
MSKSRMVTVGILVVVAVLLANGAYWYFTGRAGVWRQVQRESPQTSATLRAPSAAPVAPGSAAPAAAPAGGSTSAASTAGANAGSTSAAPAAPAIPVPAPSTVTIPTPSPSDLQFIPREKIATVSFTDNNGDDETDTSYMFYRVGHFVAGPDQGADLLQAFVSRIDWPCKGDCGEPTTVRYIEKDKVVYPLPKISDPQAPDDTVGRGAGVDTRPFATLGATAGQPMDFSVPILGYPQTLAASPRAVLGRAMEGVGTLNPAVLQLAFHDPVYGDVWMTKPGLGPQKPFYDDCKDVNPKASDSEAGCQDLPQYTDNAFYFFRPDGTYLSFVYQPEFKPEDPSSVTWKDGPLPTGSSYQSVSLVGCDWSSADAIDVVSPKSVSDDDLEAIGKVNATGDPLYGLKDTNHRLYQDFYDEYDSSFPEWASQMGDEKSRPKEVSYDDFVNDRPLFLWKDPFGRLIRFVSTKYVMPNACEPIVYLYPPEREDVRVNLGEEITVFNSYPAYRDGWLVSAEPNGELTDLNSGRKVPYLFWEGHSTILPAEESGFVVKSSDVPAFLEGILPRLGLNQKEAGDFMAAWSSKLTGAPYYFITFVNRSVIDEYFPLRIEPQPDTTIRVLMDFTPLSEPIQVQPLVLAPPPPRQGFTVVEWGVLVR